METTDIINQIAPLIHEARRSGWTFKIESASDLRGDWLCLQFWQEATPSPLSPTLEETP